MGRSKIVDISEEEDDETIEVIDIPTSPTRQRAFSIAENEKVCLVKD